MLSLTFDVHFFYNYYIGRFEQSPQKSQSVKKQRDGRGENSQLQTPKPGMRKSQNRFRFPAEVTGWSRKR